MGYYLKADGTKTDYPIVRSNVQKGMYIFKHSKGYEVCLIDKNHIKISSKFYFNIDNALEVYNKTLTRI